MGNISAFELAHRFWTAVISGGYCTHGETFLSEDDILWWSKGGELKGESPARIDFLRSIVESLPSPVEYMPEGMANLTEERILEYKRNGVPKALEHDFWVRGLTSLPDGRIKPFIMRSRGVAGHCGDRAYIWYYGRSCPAVSHISLPEGGKYDVEIIDIWEMTRTKILSNASGETKLALPGKEGIAVLAVKTD